jgi:hypothetical protein
MTIEAMKQALEALEEWEKSMSKGSLEAHRILRTAIAEAEKQETVAWRFTGIAGFERFVTDAQYKAFSPEVRAWYEPFKCASYTTPPAAPVQEPLGYWNAVEGWVELPEEAQKPAQAKTIPKWPLKHQWVNGRGYVVWRDVFEGNMKCPLDEAIAAHAQAVFVDEGDAKEYCTFKNTTPPAARPAPNDFELMKCWVEKPDGTIDGIASMRLALSKYGAAQRQPLKQERIDKIIEQCKITLVNYCSGEKQTEFARAVEAAHGITGENT